MRSRLGSATRAPKAISLLEQSLERMWPDAVAGDKGYSAAELRTWLAEREIAAVISTRDNEQAHDFDREAYRKRPLIERTINRLKRYRRIATRYDKLARSYRAMVTLACILEWV